MKKKTKMLLISYLYPNRCACCGEYINYDNDDYICETCEETFEPNIRRRTLDCGVRCAAYTEYGDAVRGAILSLKFEHYLPAAELLAKKMSFLYNYLYPDGLENAVFVPVPISKRRRRKRGCNQSEKIAKELSRLTGVPVAKNAIVKIKDNPAQSLAADVNARRKNVKDVYRIADAAAIRGKHAIVVDDVVTTGSTLNEVCRVLLPYAGSVECLTAASAELKY